MTKRFALQCLVAILLTGFTVVVLGDRTRTVIRLPGTQPGQVAPADSFQQCATCHEEIVRAWSGSPKAHAPRDPIFNALLSITNKKAIPLGLDVGEYCLRCHSPSGWLAGRSHELSVEYLYGTDLDGVHCDFCHRSVDPMAPPADAPNAGPVPGYGNGMFVVMQTGEPRRGKRGGVPAGHPTYRDEFLSSSEFCATCHEVSNPYFAPYPSTTPPSFQPALERTYTEWKLSWYATQGQAGTCQGCHMPKSTGFASSHPAAPLRLDVARHEFNGSNMLLASILPAFWDGLDTAALREGQQRALGMKRQAARIEAVAGTTNTGSRLLVRITNLTGHKLPTGFAEGRRMWLHVKGKNAQGEVIFESGRYEHGGSGLVRDADAKVYEARLGPKQATARYAGIPHAPSYHTALSDSVYFDNRIPPRGYVPAAFSQQQAGAVGYYYAEGQYWDVTSYEMPAAVRSVSVALMFQLVTPEFAAFLRDENSDNPYDWNQWGERVHVAWLEHGAPVVMAEQNASVQAGPPTLAPVEHTGLPLRILLAQNYPNPFNAVTQIEFWISARSYASLRVYDVAGREVALLADEFLESGAHRRTFASPNLASGVYLARLSAGTSVSTIKLMMTK